MTQTTQTTQQAGEATQETTSQPAETTQQATAPQPEQTAQQTTPPPAPKSAFISDGKLPQSKPQPQQAEATSKPASDDESDLKAQLTALQARLDAIESQRTTETRTAEVERIIAPLSDTLKAVYRRTPFATLTDKEYAQLTETIKKEVTELATADKARGAVFSRPTASKPTDGKASDKETDEVLRRLNL
ncbi:hypothetical protein [uncultured Porphyromonas sp.]|uniref:hypothetical protein n=1 Tax=uncultured Porphyromonas sp. TaxID=159274 RepID=UPI00261BA18F|nr:hypothetical protein [uncultured Porphyromonas sp.]